MHKQTFQAVCRTVLFILRKLEKLDGIWSENVFFSKTTTRSPVILRNRNFPKIYSKTLTHFTTMFPFDTICKYLKFSGVFGGV